MKNDSSKAEWLAREIQSQKISDPGRRRRLGWVRCPLRIQGCRTLRGGWRGDSLRPVALVGVLVRSDGRIALAKLLPSADAFASGSKAPATYRAYRGAWLRFTAWCEGIGLPSLPAQPEALALYVTHLAQEGKKVGTIEKAAGGNRACTFTRQRTEPSRYGARDRDYGRHPARPRRRPDQKAPLMADALRRVCKTKPSTTAQMRDRALLLLGFAGAFRRSELVALQVSDLVFAEDGLEVTIRRSKVDQEGRGRKLGIPLGASVAVCPVRAVRRWLDAAGIASGAVLRGVNRVGKVSRQGLTGRSVALIVKRTVAQLGLDPALYAGHSLRSGLVTSAAKAGKSEWSIMNTTGQQIVGDGEEVHP